MGRETLGRRTVIIGIDGATFDVLDQLVAAGELPFLGELLKGGVRAELGTIVPALTPPAWTSLMTGRSPGHHGIFDFFRRSGAHSQQIDLLTARDVATETIWSLASRRGMRSTVINFPLTYPAPQIDGFVVPGWMPWRQVKLGCYPKGLYERIKTLPKFNPRDLGFDFSLEEKSIEGCDPSEYEEWISFHIRKERQLFRIMELLMREEPCELTAILFDGVDKLQHLMWRFIDERCLPPEPSDWELAIRRCCLKYFSELDDIMRSIVELAGEEATILVASDHGFGAQSATFFANAWLAENGYLTWADAAPETGEYKTRGLSQIGRHVQLIDWDATKAYALTPSGNGIHIVRQKEPGGPGVPDEEYESLRLEISRGLRDVKHPDGSPLIAEIWTREEAFEGPFLDVAPDLTLVMKDGGLISILSSEEIVAPVDPPVGTHRHEGVFLATGPEIKRGVTLDPLSILDVASMALHGIGAPIPAELEGRVPEEAYLPEALRARPVAIDRDADRAASSTATTDAPELDAEAEEEIARRLRSLGYMD